MADFEAWLVFLILVVNVVGELQRKRTLAASRGFLAAARLSCSSLTVIWAQKHFAYAHNIRYVFEVEETSVPASETVNELLLTY